MGQHFLLHRDLVAATAVHHAAYAHLSNDYQRDLVVVGPQYLRVYRIEPIPETSEGHGDSHSDDGDAGDPTSATAEDETALAALPKGHVLHLLSSFPLAGVVESLRVLQFDARLLRKKKHRFHGGKDVLLLSFSLYKWVLVGYDRRTRALATLAMYSFAEDAVGPGATLKGERDGRDQLLGLSARAVACVDPQTRCGAMLIYSNQLVVVPFRSSSMELSFFEEDDEEDDEDEDEEDDLDSLSGSKRKSKGRKSALGGDDDDEEDEEEKKLEALVNETKQRGLTSDVNKRLQTLLDKSVKIGVKRKRNHMSGLLSTELTGREFLLRLRELEITGKVVDLAFLDGYLEPTLMLLHEENESNATSGRFAAGYDTYALTVISINLNTRLHPKIWSVQNLPSDCFRVVACKAPVGGVVVLSANAIMYFNQTQFNGLATNIFAEKTVNQASFPLQEAVYETVDGRKEPLNILLENCEVEFLGTTEMLLSMPNGDYYVLSLPFEDSSKPGYYRSKNTDRELSLKLRQLPSGVTASCLCADDERKTIFIGSRSGDSILYTYRKRRIEEVTESNGNGVHENENGNHVDVKEEVVEEEEEEDEEEDEDDVFLYGYSIRRLKASVEDDDAKTTNGSQTEKHGGKYRYALRQVDVLPSVGQITSIDMGLERNADSKEHREQLVVGGGYQSSGAVSILHNGLRPIVGTEAELSGCRAMWTVSSSLPSSQSSSEDGRSYNSYLILSVAQRTMVLRTGEGMEPLEEDSGFYTSGPTLAASNLFDKQRIVQIFKQGARVMMEVPVEEEEKDPAAVEIKEEKVKTEGGDGEDDEEDDEDDGPRVRLVCTQEITLDGDVESGGMNVDTSKVSIVSVDVIDPFILLLLTDGTIRVLMGDEEDLELIVIDPEVRYEDGLNPAEIVEGASDFKICSTCLFQDWAGMFRDGAWEEDTTEVKSKKARSAEETEEDQEMETLYSSAASHQAKQLTAVREGERHGFEEGGSASAPLFLRQDAAMMCGVCFDDGSLHVYSLPDFKKKGIFPYLTFAPQSLVNTMEHFQESKQKNVSLSAPALGINAMTSTSNDGRIKKSHTINSPVADMAIHRVGPSEGRLNSQYFGRMVLLVFLANGDLLMYAALPKISAPGTPTSFQFVRVSSDLITRPYVVPKTKAGTSHHENGDASNTAAILAKLRAGFRYPMLTRFLNVNNMSGVFFRGAHPMWVLTERGLPTFVPMSVPPSTPKPGAPTQAVSVPVLSFTPFHHWNCPNGFIYFHSRGALRVCELPSSKTSTILPASGGFVLNKVEFGATVHHMLYMGNHGPGGVSEALELPTYAVVCSRPFTPAVAEMVTKPEEEDEEEAAMMQEEGGETGTANTSNVMAPTAELYPEIKVEDMVQTEEDVYELRLLQTNEFGEWDRRGVFRVYFNRFEVVLSVKVMYLYDSSLLKEEVSSMSHEWNRKKKPFVVIGTGYVGPHGEDESGKGRLLLYELDYAQYATEEGSTSAKLPKLRLMFIKEHHQAAISCVAQLGPYVLVAVGMKIIVYEFKSDQLIGCAFYDAQMYIVSASVVKDYVMFGDIYKSVHFLRWKEKQRQLQLLAKDYEPLAVTSTEFNIFERRLSLLATDIEDNLHVMQYAPNDIESRGGQRLLRTSDFHVGMQVTSLFRKQAAALGPPSQSHLKQHANNNVYVNLLGTSEGSVGAVLPVGERVFRRLFTLQNVMINTLPQNCALNPREFRTLKANSRRRTGRPDAWSKHKWKKGFLDAQVLLRFLHLDYVAQKEIARCIGTTPEVIVHNLLEVQRATTSFL